MRIAILGAGFCGMAVAWNVLQHQGVEVTLFDPKGVGGGTSGIAAGLLHPYVGAHSKLNWRALDGMFETKKLLQIAEKALGRPVAYSTGMMRPAFTELQRGDFTTCASNYSDVELYPNDTLSTIPYLKPFSGIFIHSAITVDCESYLKGLWLAISALGATIERTAITTLQELNEFDSVIVTMGANTTELSELKTLNITQTKGQIIEMSWKNNLTELPYPINSQGYLLKNPNARTCIAGATFEKTFEHTDPCLEIAKSKILPKIELFFPSIEDLEIIGCRAGIRAGTPSRQPLLKKVNDTCWVLTGMGSKGLLYHALFAKELAGNLYKC